MQTLRTTWGLTWPRLLSRLPPQQGCPILDQDYRQGSVLAHILGDDEPPCIGGRVEIPRRSTAPRGRPNRCDGGEEAECVERQPQDVKPGWRNIGNHVSLRTGSIADHSRRNLSVAFLLAP